MAHINGMKSMIDYCWGTKNRGLTLKPNWKWIGKVEETKLSIKGVSDTNYVNDLETKQSVSACSMFLNIGPMAMKN
jgi:hypothetical protein